MNNELWNQRLSFIWYNDAELFHYTDEDFDAQAKAYADGGINVVVTFSCTHFRYDFYKYWDVIFDCVAKMVKACHKYGIKVVDHASCTLTHNPLNDEDAKELLNTLRVRKSSLDSWPGLLDYVTNDERIVNNGYSMKEFRQIDGRTGEWARTPYSGWCCCYNNPYYKDSYIKYLDTMYERTGIDGYMADDMQFFASGHACACEHCRKLFKEETGYDLPYPEDWGKFYGDYSNPVFVAWKRFKVRSTERFEREIYNHFLEKGVQMLRPCYMCHIVCSNWTAHCFEAASDLWNPVFQENMFSALMRYSFYDFHVEALHRYAMSTAKDAPSFSLFYPDRHDNFYFSWALSSLWGQLLLATSEGSHNTDWEREFRTFENKHKNIYTNPKKLSDLTFYHSPQTRDYTASAESMHTLYSAAQCADMAGYMTDMVFEHSSDAEFFKHKRIVCPNVTMMSDEEIARLGKFVEKGGKLIILGKFGSVRPDGSPRNFAEVVELMRAANFAKTVYLPEYRYTDHMLNQFVISRWKNADAVVEFDFSMSARMKDVGTKMYGTLVDEKNASYTGTDADLQLGYFSIEDGYVLHIVNVTDCVPTEKTAVSHHDPIPAFADGAEKLGEFTVSLKNDAAISSAVLYSPEFDGGAELAFEQADGMVKLTVPGGKFAGYGVIELK